MTLNPGDIRIMIWTLIAYIVVFAAGYYIHRRWGSIIEGLPARLVARVKALVPNWIE
jgi:hypothetical protein